MPAFKIYLQKKIWKQHWSIQNFQKFGNFSSLHLCSFMIYYIPVFEYKFDLSKKLSTKSTIKTLERGMTQVQG